MARKKTEPGVYEHFRGKYYYVLGEGQHSETKEKGVFYAPLYRSDVRFFFRPAALFHGKVKEGDKLKPRFKLILRFDALDYVADLLKMMGGAP